MDGLLSLLTLLQLFIEATAQTLSAPTLSGIIVPFPSVFCIISVCCACYWHYRNRERRPRYSRLANTNPSPTPGTSRVIYDINQSSQKGVVTPSRGNTGSLAPSDASSAGRPLVPISVPVASRYEFSGCNSDSAPPYSSLAPPYNGVQHSQVQNELESEAEVQTQPTLHGASNNSEFHNAVESDIAEAQAKPASYSPYVETPYAEKHELQPTSTPRPEIETQIDIRADSLQ